jgi:putative heme iron utilization protein
MTVEKPATSPPDSPQRAELAAEVRHLVRQASKGSLATSNAADGHPYASLVTIATDADGTPLMLLSRLALHTRNLQGDARACLLIDASSGNGDPLAGGRVSLMGRVGLATTASAPRRFLARHPQARGYAQFADFSFFALTIARAHYVGGFGRIVDFSAQELLLSEAAAGAFADEQGVLAQLNERLAPALAGYAAHHARRSELVSNWRIAGVDAEGIDLVAGEHSRRLPRLAPTTDLEQEIRALLERDCCF